MKYKPGQSGNPAGRPRGTKDKIGVRAAMDIFDAYEQRGGVEFLVKKLDAKTFAILLSKLLPKDINIIAEVNKQTIEDYISLLERRGAKKE